MTTFDDTKMTTLPTDKFELTLLLRQHMRGFCAVETTVSGTLEGLDYDEVVDHLEDLDMLAVGGNKADGKLVFMPPAYQFFPDINTFRQRTLCATVRVKEDFYIEACEYRRSLSQETPAELSALLQAGQLFKSLKPLADDVREAGDEKTLFWASKHKITLRNTASDEDWEATDGLAHFINSFLDEERQRAEKTSIIRNVLQTMFPAQPVLTLGDLMPRIDSFMQQVCAGYDLYMANFSYQQVKATVDKEKLDFVMRLDQLLSGMQNQLLAVPLALIVVATQMQSDKAFFGNNLVIMIGCLVFAFFMALLVRNQKDTLGVLGREIGRQHEHIRHITKDFDGLFDDLKSRCSRQTCVIRCIDLTVTFVVLISFSVWIYYATN